MVTAFKKNKLAWSIALIALGGLSFAGFKKYKGKPEMGGDDDAAVSKGDIEVHFMDSGELAPKIFSDVAPRVSGRVIEMAVDEGSKVKKGEKLAVIQPGRTEAEQYVPVSVTAPLDGVVMRYQKQGSYQEEGKIARLGDYVTGLVESNSPTYLMTVADLTRLVVKMKISEMDILKLKEGMPVTVSVDAMPDQKFPAKVTLVSPQAEKDNNNLKNFKVEVTLSKVDTRLKPGMTARVDGLLESRKAVLKAPLSAVFEERGKNFAYLKAGDKKQEIKLGLRSETDVEILEGLKEGDKLLTEKPKDGKTKWK
jgi:HlyD family secretion protein